MSKSPDSKFKLINCTEEMQLEWSKRLEEAACEYGHLYICSDTETTGTQRIDQTTRKFARVLEWSMSFRVLNEDNILVPVLDKKGRPIELDQAINPFIEEQITKKQKMSITHIPKDGIGTHGITEEYLFGNEPGEGGREQLPHCAAPFSEVFYALQRMMNFPAYLKAEVPVYMVFHNADFDVGFLNQEMEMINQAPIESYFIPLDTLVQSKKLIQKNEIDGYTLDSIFKWSKEKYPEKIQDMDRPIHTALIDSLILSEVFSALNLLRLDKIPQPA
mgnify:FL=1|tara:strand:- start:3895 stop:4719 length:825 start_codon:yes stop_codon:yes gene_type:complete